MKDPKDPLKALTELLSLWEQQVDAISGTLADESILANLEKVLKKDVYKTVLVATLGGFAFGFLAALKSSPKGSSDGKKKQN